MTSSMFSSPVIPYRFGLIAGMQKADLQLCGVSFRHVQGATHSTAPD